MLMRRSFWWKLSNFGTIFVTTLFMVNIKTKKIAGYQPVIWRRSQHVSNSDWTILHHNFLLQRFYRLLASSRLFQTFLLLKINVTIDMPVTLKHLILLRILCSIFFHIKNSQTHKNTVNLHVSFETNWKCKMAENVNICWEWDVD